MAHHYALVLVARDFSYAPDDPGQLIQQLQSAKFISKKFSIRNTSGFLVGDEFLKLITFMGCAPHIELSPPASAEKWVNFSYIEFRHFAAAIHFKGLNSPKASCPSCRARINIIKAVTNWTPASISQQCSRCHENYFVENLNWRHSAGFGHFFIVIHSVFPNEAVPADNLLQLLEKITTQPWDYFYHESD